MDRDELDLPDPFGPARTTIRGTLAVGYLSGGTLNSDAMRMVPEVQQFLLDMQEAGNPIAAICHAPWELVSAGLGNFDGQLLARSRSLIAQDNDCQVVLDAPDTRQAEISVRALA